MDGTKERHGAPFPSAPFPSVHSGLRVLRPVLVFRVARRHVTSSSLLARASRNNPAPESAHQNVPYASSLPDRPPALHVRPPSRAHRHPPDARRTKDSQARRGPISSLLVVRKQTPDVLPACARITECVRCSSRDALRLTARAGTFARRTRACASSARPRTTRSALEMPGRPVCLAFVMPALRSHAGARRRPGRAAHRPRPHARRRRDNPARVLALPRRPGPACALVLARHAGLPPPLPSVRSPCVGKRRQC
jgi:hypothetical protein